MFRKIFGKWKYSPMKDRISTEELKSEVPFKLQDDGVALHLFLFKLLQRFIEDGYLAYDDEMRLQDVIQRSLKDIHPTPDLMQKLSELAMLSALPDDVMKDMRQRFSDATEKELKADAFRILSSLGCISRKLTSVPDRAWFCSSFAYLLRYCRLGLNKTKDDGDIESFDESILLDWIKECEWTDSDVSLPVSLCWCVSEYQRWHGLLSVNIINELLSVLVSSTFSPLPASLPEQFPPALVSLNIICYWSIVRDGDASQSIPATDIAKVLPKLHLIGRVGMIDSQSYPPPLGSDPVLVSCWTVRSFACCFYKRADLAPLQNYRFESLQKCLSFVHSRAKPDLQHDLRNRLLVAFALRAADAIGFTSLASFTALKQTAFRPHLNQLWRLATPSSPDFLQRTLNAVAIKALYIAMFGSDHAMPAQLLAKEAIEKGALTVLGCCLQVMDLIPNFFSMYPQVSYNIEEMWKCFVETKFSMDIKPPTPLDIPGIRLGLKKGKSSSELKHFLGNEAHHLTLEQLQLAFNERFEVVAANALSSLLSFAMTGSESAWLTTIINPLVDRISKGTYSENSRELPSFDRLWDAPKVDSLDQLGYPPNTSMQYFNAMCRIGITPEFALDVIDSVEDLDDLPPGLISSLSSFVESAIMREEDPTDERPIRKILRPSFADVLEYSRSSLGHAAPELVADWKNLAAASITTCPQFDQCTKFRWSTVTIEGEAYPVPNYSVTEDEHWEDEDEENGEENSESDGSYSGVLEILEDD